MEVSFEDLRVEGVEEGEMLSVEHIMARLSLKYKDYELV